MHLEDLYVQADFRRRGIGKAFFNATYQVIGILCRDALNVRWFFRSLSIRDVLV